MISIILPAFNAAATIDRCVNSIISAKKDHIIELIIVDDGSKDETAEILKGYVEKNPWIIVQKQPQNGGLSSARNKGLDIATGDYIAFIDSDDTIDNDYFDLVVEKAVLPKLDILLFGYKRIALNGRSIETKHSPTEYSREALTRSQLRVTENKHIYNFCWSKIYSRQIIGNLRFDPDVKFGEDAIFNISYIRNVCSLLVVSDCPYNYYENPNSLTSSQYKPNLLELVEAHYKARLKAHNWSISPIEKKVILSDFANSYVESMLLYLLNNLRYTSILNRRAELVKIRKSFVYENCIPNYSKKHPSRVIRLLIASFSQRWYGVTLGILQLSWSKKQKAKL